MAFARFLEIFLTFLERFEGVLIFMYRMFAFCTEMYPPCENKDKVPNGAETTPSVVLTMCISQGGPQAGHKALHTCPSWGAFSHSARTARAQRAHSANYYGDYPCNNPENHPPAESCTINSKLKNSNI